MKKVVWILSILTLIVFICSCYLIINVKKENQTLAGKLINTEQKLSLQDTYNSEQSANKVELENNSTDKLEELSIWEKAKEKLQKALQ